MMSVDNYMFCSGYIVDVLIPSESGRGQVSQAQQPVVSYNDEVRLPGLIMHQELKEMGFSDEEVTSAVSKGYTDIQACVDFLLSPANASPLHAKASPLPRQRRGNLSGTYRLPECITYLLHLFNTKRHRCRIMLSVRKRSPLSLQMHALFIEPKLSHCGASSELLGNIEQPLIRKLLPKQLK